MDAAALALSVAANAPCRSVRELIDVSKSRSDGLNFASPGNGTVAHLTGELLKHGTLAEMAVETTASKDMTECEAAGVELRTVDGM